MAVTFNLNDEVLVELKPKGMAMYEAYWRGIGLEPPPLKTNWRGLARMQMHEVMHVFGPEMVNGREPPIGMAVEFVGSN